MTREEIWVRAACGAATDGTLSAERAAWFADELLDQYDERFATAKPAESTWGGKPLSELTDEERSAMRKHRLGEDA